MKDSWLLQGSPEKAAMSPSRSNRFFKAPECNEALTPVLPPASWAHLILVLNLSGQKFGGPSADIRAPW